MAYHPGWWKHGESQHAVTAQEANPCNHWPSPINHHEAINYVINPITRGNPLIMTIDHKHSVSIKHHEYSAMNHWSSRPWIVHHRKAPWSAGPLGVHRAPSATGDDTGGGHLLISLERTFISRSYFSLGTCGGSRHQGSHENEGFIWLCMVN